MLKLSIQSLKSPIMVVGGALLAWLIIIPFLPYPLPLVLLLTLAYVLFWLSLFWPWLGMLGLVLARPLLDVFSNQTIITFFGLSINLAGFLATAVILLYGLVFFSKHSNDSLPFKKSLQVFWLIALLGVLTSIDPKVSLAEWLRLSSIFVCFYLGFRLFGQPRRWQRLITAAILSGLIPAIIAMAQFLTNTGLTIPMEGIFNRIYGTFAHPNLLAYYLVVVISLLGFELIRRPKRQLIFWAYAALGGFYSLVLILTYTRGAWLALIATFGIAGLLRFRKFLLIFCLVLFVVYAGIGPIRNRVNDLTGGRYSSIQWRFQLWSDSMNYLGDRLILGYGTGTAKEVILKQRGEEAGSADPHNDYLKLALENGLVGLITYIWLLLLIVNTLVKHYRKAVTPEAKNFLVIYLGLSLALFGLSAADNILRNTVLQWVYWLVLGSTLAAAKHSLQNNN
ncbi:MAG: O-antigen ligase family protein [Candidatus Falkowbacteria bacterium]